MDRFVGWFDFLGGWSFDFLDLSLRISLLIVDNKNAEVETPLLVSNHFGFNKEVDDVKRIPIFIVGKLIFLVNDEHDIVGQLLVA